VYYYPHSSHNLLGTGSLIPKLTSPEDINLDSEPDIIRWLDETTFSLSEFYASWYRMCLENISIYTGVTPYDQHVSWAGDIPISVQQEKNTKTNFVCPLVETHVSRLTGTRAAVSVLPAHSTEYSDKSAAKTGEQVAKTILYDRKYDHYLEKSVRQMLICGSSALKVDWDPKLGTCKVDPQTGIPECMGDVGFKLLAYDEVFIEPAPRDEIGWYIEIDRVNVERLKEQYPHKASSIQEDTHNPFMHGDDTQVVGYNHDKAATVFTLYQKATDNLPNGLMIKATKREVLEVSEFPYPSMNKVRQLNLCLLDDIVPPGMVIPIPLTVLEASKGPQVQVNQLNKIISRNISISAPKWIVQRGSVSVEHLNNAAAVLQYRGSTRPSLETASTVPAEVMNYRQTLIDNMRENTGAFKQSFGDAAPNTRANSMLEFHEEQEFKKAEPLIKRVNDFISESVKKALMVASDYYQDDQDRTIQVMGRRPSGPYRRFKAAELSGSFDIRIERTSNLPDSKEGKLRWVTTLAQNFPGKFDWEQVKKALDLSDDSALETPETAAYELQLLENDMLFQGVPCKSPTEYQDHISHLKAIYPIIDSIPFAELPESLKKGFLSHVMAHEMFAWKKSLTNAAWATKLMQMPHFPKVFISLPSVMPPVSAEMPVPAPEVGSKYSEPQITEMPTSKPPSDQTDVADTSSI
jgi:hypothetical protein